MVDHLVLTGETVLASPVAALVGAIDELEVFAIMDDSNMPLEIGVTIEACTSALCV